MTTPTRNSKPRFGRIVLVALALIAGALVLSRLVGSSEPRANEPASTAAAAVQGNRTTPAPGESQAAGGAAQKASLTPSSGVVPAAVNGGASPDADAGSDAANVASRDEASVDGGSAAESVRDFLKQNAESAAKYVDQFCDESRKLAASDVLRPTSRSRDAAPYMAGRVDWEGGKRPPGLLHLAAPLRQRLREYGAQWPGRIQPYDLEGLDFRWMRELQQFDHWTILRQTIESADRDAHFYNADIPNFVDLMNWTRLRLARAMVVGDVPEAVADVRHLAHLLRTTGLVVADMIAFKLLDLEREAREHAIAQGRDVSRWPAVDAENLARMRRLARSGPMFTFPGVPEDVMKKALECNAVSRCSAIYEGLGAHVTMGHLAERDTAASISALAAESGCDEQTLGWIRKNRPFTAEEAINVMPTDDVIVQFLGQPAK